MTCHQLIEKFKEIKQSTYGDCFITRTNYIQRRALMCRNIRLILSAFASVHFNIHGNASYSINFSGADRPTTRAAAQSLLPREKGHEHYFSAYIIISIT